MSETPKFKRSKKAYRVNLNKIDEGYLCCEEISYAETLSKAKSELLRVVKYHGWSLNRSDDEITFLNIPVVRAPEYDKFIINGSEMTMSVYEALMHEMKRNDALDDILSNPEITHCYIKKNGSYYRPNSCGYTDHIARAGVYSKKQAVSEAKSVSEIQVIPINVEVHNNMINTEIEDFKKRLIP